MFFILFFLSFTCVINNQFSINRIFFCFVFFWFLFSSFSYIQSVAIISVFFICVSIFSFCIKTHPNMRVPVIYNRTIKQPPNFRPPYSRYSSIPYEQHKQQQEQQEYSIHPYHHRQRHHHKQRQRPSYPHKSSLSSTIAQSSSSSSISDNKQSDLNIDDNNENKDFDDNESKSSSSSSKTWKESWTLDKHKTDAHDAFFYIESICNAWFSFEIATRFLVSFIWYIQCWVVENLSTFHSTQIGKKNRTLLNQRKICLSLRKVRKKNERKIWH